MTQFKKMKMRINNPDHSKAVQEWLFEQGYEWVAYDKTVKNWNLMWEEGCFLYTTSEGEIFWDKEEYYNDCEGEEINVQHLDPHTREGMSGNDTHLYNAPSVPLTPAKSFTDKPQQSAFNNMLTNLKHVQKAIEKADNKQQKRLQDRDRMMQKINDMLPEGFVVQLQSKDDSNQLIVGSVWECLEAPRSECHRDCSVGSHYNLTEIGKQSVSFYDDEGDEVTLYKENLFKYFKRIS